MSYLITLSNGTILSDLTLNGDNFISDVEVTEATFAGGLKAVIITDEDGNEEIHGEMKLIQIATYGDGKYWFVLADKTAEDLRIEKLDGLSSDMSDGWNASATYTAGEYVMHNNGLWISVYGNHNVEPGASSQYWKKVNIAGEFNRLATLIKELSKEA